MFNIKERSIMYQMIGSPLINLTSQSFGIDIPAYSTDFFGSIFTFFQFYSSNGFGKKKVYLHSRTFQYILLIKLLYNVYIIPLLSY